ncbi:MAG: transposase [Candidatus Saccharicenans sp.]|nr:transposase [Candidatus Saccharicenans sp.]
MKSSGFSTPYLRVTRRLARYIVDLWPHRYGILNRCQYPINTGGLEGLNNKIIVIKRKSYGFHDLGYFSPKIIQAFTN